ncbi:MAG TPA: hypothetical protein PLR74_14525 [Agriterribacter sp.]|nr:hypothetical protein [Agriterribacter sp.]
MLKPIYVVIFEMNMLLNIMAGKGFLFIIIPATKVEYFLSV